MAAVEIDGSDLVVRLSALEQLAAFRFGEVRIPLATVAAATVEPNAWAALRGIRAPGTGIPNVIAYGTRRFSGGKDLALVRGGRGPALRVDLDDGAPFSRLVITVPDPQAQADAIRSASGRLDT